MAKEDSNKQVETSQISRKKFLKGAGTTVAGVALLGGFGSLMTGCAEDGERAAADSQDSKIEVPEHPFEYQPLDPDKVAERAYHAYFEGG
ncbi:hypothetical protein [Natranaerobius thermophilus]|nr:hypothetical protein [Natranaerobius thermophilus]